MTLIYLGLMVDTDAFAPRYMWRQPVLDVTRTRSSLNLVRQACKSISLARRTCRFNARYVDAWLPLLPIRIGKRRPRRSANYVIRCQEKGEISQFREWNVAPRRDAAFPRRDKLAISLGKRGTGPRNLQRLKAGPNNSAVRESPFE